ncbi:aaa atpase family [Fusarium heterosporum]|uniref:Aaa atpase family n=1 Tax=Fusarium heterosporum TaxID=42747 RepID=A0A8H5WQV5_FUSHE|nr:aaa atpase family [Fusarium heterosporum]
MPLPVVHLNGFPGKLVHNHLLIDPAGAVLLRTSADYQPLRCAIRAVIFDTISVSQDTFDSVFVFTDFQSDDSVGRGVMAARRGCTFVPITVNCTKEENLRRLVSSERDLHGKLTDADLVARIRDNSVVHQWPNNSIHLELDLTRLDADTSAGITFKHLMKVCKKLSETSEDKTS